MKVSKERNSDSKYYDSLKEIFIDTLPDGYFRKGDNVFFYDSNCQDGYRFCSTIKVLLTQEDKQTKGVI